MFFNKTNISTSTIISKKISILGTGPTALYIASSFQKIGHDVNIICPPLSNRKNIDITIKDSTKLSSSHFKINLSYELSNNPDFLFIASELPNLHSDLLLISPSKLSKTNIISLTPSVNPNFINQNIGQQSISAYLSAWLSQNGNTISLNSSSPQIIFNLPSDSKETSQIQNIFNNNDIKLIFKDSPLENFWNWFAPIALTYIINNAITGNIKDLSKTIDGRNILDNCINELSQLALLDGITLNKTTILSNLYNAPTNHFSTKDVSKSYSQQLLSKINMLLFRNISPEDKRFPTLKNLLNKIYNIC